MLGALVSLLIAVIILGVIFWAIQQLLPLIPLAEPFRTIVHVLVVVIGVIFVVWALLAVVDTAGVHVPLFYR